MSVPISICLIAKAAESEQAYQRVLARMNFNADCGRFSLWSCHHQPPCVMPHPVKVAALIKRLKADLAARKGAA